MTPELIKHMLVALETPTEELSKWEENFIASITEQFEKKGSLSDRQVEVLESIYNDKS